MKLYFYTEFILGQDEAIKRSAGNLGSGRQSEMEAKSRGAELRDAIRVVLVSIKELLFEQIKETARAIRRAK